MHFALPSLLLHAEPSTPKDGKLTADHGSQNDCVSIWICFSLSLHLPALSIHVLSPAFSSWRSWAASCSSFCTVSRDSSRALRCGSKVPRFDPQNKNRSVHSDERNIASAPNLHLVSDRVNFSFIPLHLPCASSSHELPSITVRALTVRAGHMLDSNDQSKAQNRLG